METWLVEPDELMRLLGNIEARLTDMDNRLNDHFQEEEVQGRKLDQLVLDVSVLKTKMPEGHRDEHAFVQQLIEEKETQNTLRQKLIEAVASKAVLVILGAGMLLALSLVFPEALKWFK